MHKLDVLWLPPFGFPAFRPSTALASHAATEGALAVIFAVVVAGAGSDGNGDGNGSAVAVRSAELENIARGGVTRGQDHSRD